MTLALHDPLPRWIDGAGRSGEDIGFLDLGFRPHQTAGLRKAGFSPPR
jgi:hypothetical protein